MLVAGNILNYIFGIIEIIIISGIIIRLIHNNFSKEKEEKAVVINKQCFDRQIYRKNQVPFVKKECIVTFQCKKKKRHFDVSELSYDNYKVGQKGALKYKGNHLIDFL